MLGVVGVVHRDVGYPWTWTNLMRMRYPCPVGYVTVSGTHIARQRNEVVRAALEQGADWILFVDDDHLFPPDALLRLYSRSVWIIGATYLTRKPPYRVTAFIRHDDRMRSITTEEMATSELWEVDAVGMGFTLIRREVFEQVPEPWFVAGVGWNPQDTSEDVYFCRKAREHAAIPTYLDTTLRIGHLAAVAVMLEADGAVRMMDPSEVTW